MRVPQTDEPDAVILRRALRSTLAAMGGPVHLLAESLLGDEDARIDWLAVEPSGRLWVVLVDATGDEDGRLVSGLAQRAWVRDRLPDWRQLARDLPIRGDDPPLLVLLAPEFSRAVRVAAEEADRDGIRLGRFRWHSEAGRSAELRLERLAPIASSSRNEAPRASVFKSALKDHDFEKRGLLPSKSPEGSDNSRLRDDNS